MTHVWIVQYKYYENDKLFGAWDTMEAACDFAVAEAKRLGSKLEQVEIGKGEAMGIIVYSKRDDIYLGEYRVYEFELNRQ